MRSTALFLAGLTAVAYAAIDPSVIAQIPDCASTPLISGIAASGCQITDTDCICGNSQLLTNLQAAIKTGCSAADVTKTLEVTAQICPNLGAGGGASPAADAGSAATSSVASVVPSDVATAAMTTDDGSAATTTLSTYTAGTGSSMINYTSVTGAYTPPAGPTVTPSTGAATRSFALGSVAMAIGALSLFFAVM